MLAVCLFVSGAARAEKAGEAALFAQLDLTRPGLEAARQAVNAGRRDLAAEALLAYFRSRSAVRHPEVTAEVKAELLRKGLSAEDRQKADDGLKHIFFAHKGYKPLFYGDDIDWQLWPVKDNELRFQLHRMYWWDSMGKAYWASGDERYAREWVIEYEDWIKKNPPGLSAENDAFAWRPLEVSARLEGQTGLFVYFINSPSFDARFLLTFLENYGRHADYLGKHFSERGNHLLFEAQRMIYAGTFFPEFKAAAQWRQAGVDILNREIDRQVYADGWQNELDPGYDIAAIRIFCKALGILELNGFGGQFPPSYKEKVERMIGAVIDFQFPDDTYPMFSDAKQASRSGAIKDFQGWARVFPLNSAIEYFATEGKSGALPDHLSAAHREGGFYTLRNGWDGASTVLVLKAGPPAFWHNQPDNGTFDLWVKGRDFFPDPGSYVYGGDDAVLTERNWFRQTRVHQTLTLDGKDIAPGSKLLEWSAEEPGRVALVYENPSYKDLSHRRSVYFLDRKFFVVIDEALGTAKGDVAVHYTLREGAASEDAKTHSFQTRFEDGNNVFVQGFASQPLELKPEEGWVSYAYRQKIVRPAYAFETQKGEAPVRMVTVIYPLGAGETEPVLSAKIVRAEARQLAAEVSVNGKLYSVGYSLNP
ncbi:MAG: heparin-sulfate lyase HepC [Chthoniobacteraceae bacterium]